MRILLVRLSALGDVIHALPALDRLRLALPAAELWWVSEPHAAPVLEEHPALDRLVVIERRALTRNLGAWGHGAARLRQLRRARFDVALDLQGLLRSALVTRAAGAKRTFGPAWAREGARWLYRERQAVPRPGEAHAVERARVAVDLLLGSLGLAVPSEGLAPARLPARFFEAPAQEPAGEGPLLSLLPGAGKPANRLPAQLLAEVADRCARSTPGLRVAIVGGPFEREPAEALAQACRVARPVSYAGDASLLESGRLLAASAAVLGGDTGPLHLARALGRPVVAVFHAAEAARTSPAGLPGLSAAPVFSGAAECSPCRARTCQRPDRVRVCLDTIRAEALAGALIPLLST